MPYPSPSPPVTTTLRSELPSLAPVATGIDLPCTAWKPYELKKPGRFDEHPIPETINISLGLISRSAAAFCNPFSTPKSPQPGHQSGFTSDLYS